MWKTLLGIAIAGAAGTLARYGLSELIDRRISHNFFGTLAANALGCLLFGVALAWLSSRYVPEHPVRLMVLTGFMGAFTTFSTYAFLSSNLIGKHQYAYAAAHILAHNVLGIGLFFLGWTLVSRWA